MALYRYLKRKISEEDRTLPAEVPSLSAKDVQRVNDDVKRAKLETPEKGRGQYNVYTAKERAQIGKYAAENGPASAVRHFSKVLGRNLPEATARRLKAEYLVVLKSVAAKGGEKGAVHVASLPKMAVGRPLLLGKDLDICVQDYINALRKVGGVVNTTIAMAAANGIIAARNPALLVQHGGHLEITKAWAKSLFQRMGYVKRKCSNAGKVTVARFEEVQEEFLADIQAEVLMNDVPPSLILNWDQTAIKLVPTGEWTMHRAKDRVIPIASSDDKRQITAVLGVTLTGEYLPPQLIYQGKTLRCHPKVSFPQEWDIWHSDNHWSTEDTMTRYIEEIVVPYLLQNREALKLAKTHPAVAIFDCFKGQTTPGILTLLERHNIIPIHIPANCTDKLQPLDVSINKPLKDEMKRRFQTWYAAEVEKQLNDDIPIEQVKVEMPASIIKNESAKWMMSAWQDLQKRPDMAINGFRKAGILNAVNSVTN